MKKANISWLIKNNQNNYDLSYDYYLGNINGNEDTSITIQVWNNYQGFEDAETIHDAKLILKTTSIDDSYIFDYLTVRVNKTTKKLIKYSDVKYGVQIGTLSGLKNNGSETSQEALGNKNMCTIELIFNAIDFKVKEGLKHLVLDIESNT